MTDPLLHLPGPGKARPLLDGLDHPEGVAWSPAEGAVYAGGEAGQIYRVCLKEPKAEVVADVGGQVLGVTLDGAGRVLACAPGVSALTVVDDRGVHSVVSTAEGRPVVTPNYAAFAPDGMLYFTDAGTWEANDGRVLAMAPDGVVFTFSSELNRALPRSAWLGRSAGVAPVGT